MRFWFLLCLCGPASLMAEDVVETFVRYGQNHSDGRAAFSFNTTPYQGDLTDLPIGVFDSGIGGLTVLEAILKLDVFDNVSLKPGADGKADLERERFIYFGDQANMPYGNYSSAGKTDYLRELILKDTAFLLGQRWFDPQTQTFRYNKPPVKAVVIACNTATAYGIEDIRSAFQKWNLPVLVIGVVEAGARGVQEAQRESAGAIGILATVGTCASGAYPRVIGRTLGLAGRSIPTITQHGSAALAGVIEGDPAFPQSVSECAAIEIKTLLTTHRQSGAAQPLSTLVLGCTHYPLARAELAAAMNHLRGDASYQALIAAEIAYVDPAEWTARELFRSLASARLRKHSTPTAVSEPDLFYLSIPNPLRSDLKLSPERGLDKDFKYGRNPGELDREDTVNAPLHRDNLPEVSRKLVESRLPEVSRRMSSR